MCCRVNGLYIACLLVILVCNFTLAYNLLKLPKETIKSYFISSNSSLYLITISGVLSLVLLFILFRIEYVVFQRTSRGERRNFDEYNEAAHSILLSPEITCCCNISLLAATRKCIWLPSIIALIISTVLAYHYYNFPLATNEPDH